MDGQKFKKTCISNRRILAYCSLVLICSIISLPDDYKIGKDHVLNQWFVKLGWFWTCSVLLPLAFSNILPGDKEGVSLAMLRVFFASILWYISVNFFQFIDEATGFDISGHTFLLTFSNLLLSSETEHCKKSSTSNVFYIGRTAISPQLPIQALGLIWDFMLLQTAFYYHTILQKTIALLWAIGSWYLVHSLFYETKSKARWSSRSMI